jgi:hypothetical protein
MDTLKADALLPGGLLSGYSGQSLFDISKQAWAILGSNQ